MEHIYIVEDDEAISELLRCTLTSYGYKTTAFDCATPMLDKVCEDMPQLILMDIMMPNLSGTEALSILRSRPLCKDIPVILITAKSSEADKIKGLDLGADDYITKPFGIGELTARVRVALRRSSSPQKILKSGDIEIDPANHKVICKGEEIELTLKEYELLSMLMQNREKIMSREELLNLVWGYDYVGETRTVDMHIKTLRAKLKDNVDSPIYIKTYRSVGYKFVG